MRFSFGITTLAFVLASGIALAGTGVNAVYKLHALNASGQTGTVTLQNEGPRGTLVIIAISGESSSAGEPAHIHIGSCGPSVGAVKFPLSNVVAGHSETLVPSPFSKVNATGLSVNVHKSAAHLNHYVACANIKPE